MLAHRSLLPLLALVAGCATTSPQAPGPALPNKQPNRVRLGHLVWQGNSMVTVCTRRIDDDANTVGVAGPCWKAELGASGLSRIVSWMGAGPQERRPLASLPGTICGFEYEDAVLTPVEKPAKLYFVAPSGRSEIYSWPPPPGATADAYQLETSLAPDGKTLAILRLQLGLGEGQRIVEPEGVELRPAPACQ